MLRPEIRPEIHHLPRPEPNQHPHRPQRKPLHPLIRALIRVPQFLLPRPEVLHLRHDLVDGLLDAAEFGFYRFEFLGGLDRGPVFGVGADVDVEFDVPDGGGGRCFGLLMWIWGRGW